MSGVYGKNIFGAVIAIGFLLVLFYIWGEDDAGVWSLKRFFKTIYECVVIVVVFITYSIGAFLLMFAIPMIMISSIEHLGLIDELGDNETYLGSLLLFFLLYQIPWYKNVVEWIYQKFLKRIN